MAGYCRIKAPRRTSAGAESGQSGNVSACVNTTASDRSETLTGAHCGYTRYTDNRASFRQTRFDEAFVEMCRGNGISEPNGAHYFLV